MILAVFSCLKIFFEKIAIACCNTLTKQYNTRVRLRKNKLEIERVGKMQATINNVGGVVGAVVVLDSALPADLGLRLSEIRGGGRFACANESAVVQLFPIVGRKPANYVDRALFGSIVVDDYVDFVG